MLLLLDTSALFGLHLTLWGLHATLVHGCGLAALESPWQGSSAERMVNIVPIFPGQANLCVRPSERVPDCLPA